LATTDAKPDISVERENTLIMAFTLMQETLKPVERAVFLLREVFDYDYSDTAAIVGKAEANCRQIVRRAKAQLLANSTPPPQPNEQARQLVEQFVSAAATGDVKDLLALVKEESPSDGGDRAKAKCRKRGSVWTVSPPAHTRRVSCSRASKPAGSDTPTALSPIYAAA
jgi:RNA polymerase sigma-70 factor (ECF subfamily)